LAFLIALLFSVNSFDSELYDAITRNSSSHWVENLMDFFSKTGENEFLLSIALIYSASGDTITWLRSKEVIFTAIPTTIGVALLKRIIRRERPSSGSDGRALSFPSGHAAAAFLYAGFFSDYYPKLKIPLYLWAFMVGISRISLKRHWPTDVIAGAIIGYLASRIGIRYRKVLRRIRLFHH